MKKVLFIAPSPLYLEKGSSLRMYSTAKILSNKYELDIVTYSLGQKFEIKNSKIYRTPLFYKPKLKIGKPTFSKITLDFLMFLKILKLSFLNKYDIIHCEDFEGIGLGYFSSWLNLNSKYVYNLHNRVLDNIHINSKPKKSRDSILLFLEKRFINKANLIILNWDKYKKDDSFNQKKIFLYYDKIDLNLTKVKNIQKPYLIYAGNFEKYQGLFEFISLFLELNTNLKLYLVGKPSKEIINLIKKKKAEQKIILLGKLPINQTNYLIKNSLAGILPRTKGTQPSMKLIHYLIWEKPVIATNLECNKELIKHKYNGFLYKNNKQLKKILIEIEDLSKNKEIIKNLKKTKNNILEIWDEKRFLYEYTK